MKALIFRDTGEPKSVLKLAEIPTPPLAPGEALVRTQLSPINPSDLHMVRGRYGYQLELPASPGAEGVGIVEAVGPGVQGPIVETRVVFVHTWNTWRGRSCAYDSDRLDEDLAKCRHHISMSPNFSRRCRRGFWPSIAGSLRLARKADRTVGHRPCLNTRPISKPCSRVA
jgi:D-arabinose 1-dehydrogenase-like Zn-dependent alcohol dehydrogenase